MTIPRDLPSEAGSTPISLGSRVALSILSTVKAAWDRVYSCPDIHDGCSEVTITERLRESMRQVLEAKARPWERTMAVLPGTESKSRPDLTRPDGITDIPIWLNERFQEQGVHDPHAIIECKRLSGADARLCRLYVIEGIDRFKSGKYGRDHEVGFMAGYLVAGTATAAAMRVNKYLAKKARNSECLHPSNLVLKCWAWRSSHLRSSGKADIQLHHAHLRLRLRPNGNVG